MKNKYKNIDFILLPMIHMPFQSILLILYTIFSALMPAYQTIVLGNFIDCAMDIFDGTRSSHDIIVPIILIILYVLFTNLMPSIIELVSLTWKNKMTLKLKEIILNKRASLEYMHIENAETQELINRACSNPIGDFESGFNTLLSATSIIISSISLLLIIMSSTFISGIIIIAVSIPLFFVAMRIGKQNYEMGKESKKIKRRYSYLSSVLTEREYAQERKLFGYSSSLKKKFSDLYSESFKVEKNIEKKSYANMKSGSIVTLMVIAIIIIVLLLSLDSGKITIGAFIALVNASFGLVQTMSWKLSSTMGEYSRLQEYLKDLNLFFCLSEKENACSLPQGTDDFLFDNLEFKNVSFKYPSSEIYVLNNCSFVLTNGNSYSFVGANGAGKSTIIKLLVGLYDHYEGEILINDRNLKEYDYSTIKTIMSVLFQDFAKYSISFKENIIIGNGMIYNKDRFENVISDVGLEYISEDFKNGINTPLGKIKEGGVDVSGGEWQKIAIARLLYSESKINILDEPTASLDPIAESQVYKMFRRINANRFTIFITHRLGAAKLADEILVVDRGQIVETGNHEQLMSIKGGLYHKMFDSQKSWYE